MKIPENIEFLYYRWRVLEKAALTLARLPAAAIVWRHLENLDLNDG